MKKRLLASLLTLVMLLGLLPTTAFAAWWNSPSSYDAYFYILHPGANQSTTATGDFDFAGQGSVPSSYGAATRTSRQHNYPTDVTQPPVDETQTFPGNVSAQTFPDITYNGKTYVYEDSSKALDAQYTYSVTWYRAKSAPGYK